MSYQSPCGTYHRSDMWRQTSLWDTSLLRHVASDLLVRHITAQASVSGWSFSKKYAIFHLFLEYFFELLFWAKIQPLFIQHWLFLFILVKAVSVWYHILIFQRDPSESYFISSTPAMSLCLTFFRKTNCFQNLPANIIERRIGVLLSALDYAVIGLTWPSRW